MDGGNGQGFLRILRRCRGPALIKPRRIGIGEKAWPPFRYLWACWRRAGATDRVR